MALPQLFEQECPRTGCVHRLTVASAGFNGHFNTGLQESYSEKKLMIKRHCTRSMS